MDPNTKNNHGDTPLHTACRNERSKQVQLLVRDERCNSHEKNSRGDTAVHVACRLSNGRELVTICCHVPVVYMNKCVSVTFHESVGKFTCICVNWSIQCLTCPSRVTFN